MRYLESFAEKPPAISDVFGKASTELSDMESAEAWVDFISALFVFLFVDLFDTIVTLSGVGKSPHQVSWKVVVLKRHFGALVYLVTVSHPYVFGNSEVCHSARSGAGGGSDVDGCEKYRLGGYYGNNPGVFENFNGPSDSGGSRCSIYHVPYCGRQVPADARRCLLLRGLLQCYLLGDSFMTFQSTIQTVQNNEGYTARFKLCLKVGGCKQCLGGRRHCFGL